MSNTRYRFLIISTIMVLSCQTKNHLQVYQDTTTEEWIDLFNGEDLSGWDIKIAGADLGENYKNTFVVEDSMIRIKYDEYEEFNDAFGHMYYQQPYSHYKLSFDYRFTGDQLNGGASWNVRNSGVMVHSQSAQSNEYKQGFPVSVELQLLGGLNDGKDRTTGNVCTPGTAVMMADTINYNHCISSTSETYHGDQWVHAEVIANGGEEMIFIIEADTVLRFDRPMIAGGFISAEFQGKDWDQFGVVDAKQDWISKDGTVIEEGYIALQAESHPIDFKNIKLLNLCGCQDRNAKNYKNYFTCHQEPDCQY